MIRKPTKEQFEEYVAIRYSGVTNMFDIEYIKSISTTGLKKEHCIYIMRHFVELAAELMKQLVEQVRVTNVKLGRFENLLGQMHANTIGIKDNTKELENVMRENKSSVAGIAGRVRDLAQQFKR